jgi:SnoaL-like domain
MNEAEHLLRNAYRFFNARDINAIIPLMSPNVHWANGWEGGFVEGPEAVRDYWSRQWKEIDPKVVPVHFKENADGRIEVKVHQVAKDLKGNLLFDGMVKHVYTIKNGLIQRMEIENV